ncbi:MAG: hypothetical protein Q9182_001392 [Xanthomendoza sp. 2 TL-2023]
MDASHRLEQTSDALGYERDYSPPWEYPKQFVEESGKAHGAESAEESGKGSVEEPGEQPGEVAPRPEGFIRRRSLDSLASITASIGNDDKAKVPEILYRVEYRDFHGALRRGVRDTKPIKIKPRESRFLQNGEDPVIEILTEVKRPRPTREGAEFPQTIGRSILTINSPQLIKREKLVFGQPYAPLLHYLSELEQYREDLTTPASQSIGFQDETQSALSRYHVGLLLSILHNSLPPKMSLDTVRNLAGLRKTTFEWLWLLFRPGTDVYIRTDHGIQGAVVDSISQGSLSEVGREPCKFTIWSMVFDGRVVGRRYESWSIAPFDGEREITSLDIHPCHYWENQEERNDRQTRREELEARGSKYIQLTSKRYMHHKGETIAEESLDDRVMVDSASYFATHSQKIPILGRSNFVGDKTRVVKDEEMASESRFEKIPINVHERRSAQELDLSRQQQKDFPFADYDFVPLDKLHALTPHQRFLCPYTVFAFVMKTRKWESLHIDCLSEPLINVNAIDNLVMDEGTKNMIKALTYSYTRPADSAHQPWSADFIQNKGKGQIFLLHGRPGVGKTYTAECVAEYTRRPLLSLTCGDIGTEPAEVERQLNDYFGLAKLWGAVLLLDEADIYLEQRITQDLKRNIFLRAMEYYQGILFLTTNRVGTFDDAFISRIHVVLRYKDFTPEDRIKIWDNFFNKLEAERSDIYVSRRTIEYATQSSDMVSVKWNGREIRNAFQTAVALAEFEAKSQTTPLDVSVPGKIELKEKHLKQIVNMSSNFKRYLDELHVGDESKRAKRFAYRHDEFEG